MADPFSAILRMTSEHLADTAAAADVLNLFSDGGPVDPIDQRDADYIEATLPAIRIVSDLYFRSRVEGLENIPAEGPVLLVGNHSGGTLIADTFVFAEKFVEHFGTERRFHQLAHDLVFKVPGARRGMMKWGTVPANPRNMRRALAEDAALLVYPGGDHETYRPTWEQDRIDFAGRRGFVKLALELGVKIVPVVSIGGQETALFLGRGQRFSRALGLDRLLRLKVLPAQIAPPFGFTVLDLPGRVPLPAKIVIRVLEPIDLREELGAKPDPADGYDVVVDRMQDTLDELADERLLPIIG